MDHDAFVSPDGSPRRPRTRDLTRPRARAGRHRRADRTRLLRPAPSLPRWFRSARSEPSSVIALLLFAAGCAGAVTIAVNRAQILPAKFSFDAHFIQTLAQGADVQGVDRSYANTAALYRAVGLQDAPVLVALVTVVLFGALTLVALMSREDARLPIPVGALAAVSMLLAAVYLGTYSKDLPVLAVTAALLVLGRGRTADVAVIAVMVAYATIFRTYWVLVVLVYLSVRVLRRFWPRRAVWPLAALVAIVVVAVGITLGLHESADHFRHTVNAGRINDVDARTMLRPFFDLPEPWGGVANVMATFLLLFLPIPLLQLGGGYYIAVFLLFVAVWGSFWWALMKQAPTSARDRLGRFRASAALLALVVVQAFFEPDYGSVLRHLTPLLPVLLLVVVAAVRPRGSAPPLRVVDGAADAGRRARRPVTGDALLLSGRRSEVDLSRSLPTRGLVRR